MSSSPALSPLLSVLLSGLCAPVTLLPAVLLLLLPCLVLLKLRLGTGPSLRHTRGRTIAHRCGNIHSPDEPENTIQGMRHSCGVGVDGVEVDVLVSQDGVPFVFHDFSFARLCGVDTHSHHTPWKHIAALSFCAFNAAVVQGVDLKYRNSPPHVPSLDEMVKQVLADDDLLFYIEIKEIFRLNALCVALSNIFKEHPELYRRACIISFNPYALYKIRSLDPNICTVVLIRKKPISSWASSCPEAFPWWVHCMPSFWDRILYWSCWTWIPWFVGASGVGVHNSILSLDDVRKFQQRGYEVNVWVVNDEQRKQDLLDLGASVTTDTLFSRRCRPTEEEEEAASSCSPSSS